MNGVAALRDNTLTLRDCYTGWSFSNQWMGWIKLLLYIFIKCDCNMILQSIKQIISRILESGMVYSRWKVSSLHIQVQFPVFFVLFCFVLFFDKVVPWIFRFCSTKSCLPHSDFKKKKKKKKIHACTKQNVCSIGNFRGGELI